jgi:predicted permease
MRFGGWLDSVRQDLAHALRQMRRAPGFSSLAVLTFALGIGLATAVFAAVDNVLLRPLPFAEPQRLLSLQSVDSTGQVIPVVSADNWDDWRGQNRTLEAVAIHLGGRAVATVGGDAARVSYEVVSSGFFEVVRPRLVFGRTFTETEYADGAAVVVISEPLWRNLLGARTDPDLQLDIGGRPHRVIGVVAGGQEYPTETEAWLAYRHTQIGGAVRNNINWSAVGRLARGATIEQTRTDLATIARRIRETDPAALYSWGVHVIPLRDVLLGEAPRYLRLLMTAVGFVLLIACANLASANLARGATRAREMAVRAALGAGRWRIARQLVVEHVVLAIAGGMAGVGLAWLLTRATSAIAATQLPRATEIRIDQRVLIVAFALSLLAGLLAGMMPAVQASRASLRGGLTGSGRSVIGGGRSIPGAVLVGFEIAVSVLLVAGAGLLIQSFRTLVSRPLGFETRNVATAEISLIGTPYTDRARAIDYWGRLVSELRTLPGADGAAIANWVPLGTAGTGFIEIGGKELPGAGAGYRIVSDGYFHTLGVPILSGRDFGAGDDSTSLRTVIINRAMAEKYWPGENPLGKQVRASSMESRRGSVAPWLTVIGIVGDVRHWGYDAEFTPEMYVSYRQAPYANVASTAVVRSRGSGVELLTAVRDRVRMIDSRVPADVELLSARAERMTAERRFTMSVLSVFGGLALVLAAVGIYAVLSFSVAQRTREIAVRAALGADRRNLMSLVMTAGATVIGAGIATGLAGAFVLTRLMQALLYEVSPHDPVVLGAAVVLIGVVALAAAAVPAHRAARVEPMVALKAE